MTLAAMGDVESLKQLLIELALAGESLDYVASCLRAVTKEQTMDENQIVTPSPEGGDVGLWGSVYTPDAGNEAFSSLYETKEEGVI
jgi:hypothetical protein